MTLRVTLLLLALQAGNISPVRPAENGSLEGMVVRSGTREPLANVLVILNAHNNLGEIIDYFGPNPSAWTDTSGRFSIKDLAPGTYRLTLSANGYVRQEYGQRTFPGKGVPIAVASGQIKKDLIAEMTPTGSVSGTIRDENNRPLSGVPVQLLRMVYDSFDGYKRLQPSAIPASGPPVRTDDRGEYRIYFVTPGRYHLNAGTPPGPSINSPIFGVNEVEETYGYLYYPGVADPKSASEFEVHPGESKVAIDMKLSRQQGVRVRGRVIDSATGLPPANPKVRLNYREPDNGQDFDLQSMGRGKVLYKDGNFEFSNVLPGLFTVSATVEEPSLPPAAPPGIVPEPLKRTAYVPIEVANSDVEGIVLNLSQGASLAGSIRVEGQRGLRDAMYSLVSGPVSLSPSSNGLRPTLPGLPWLHSSAVSPDGMFRIDNVLPGEYVLRVRQKLSTFYVKAARFGSTDVLKAPFQYSGEAGNFEIVLSPNVASVDGTVTGRLSSALGAQVVLVPDQPGFREDLFQVATTDPNGRFSIRNIAPGDYKLYAWEAIEPYSWFDPEVTKRYEQFAQRVHLTESARQTIDLRLIPASSR